jgi:hypothetical protein
MKHFHTLVHKLSANYIIRMYSNYIYMCHTLSILRGKKKQNPENVCLRNMIDLQELDAGGYFMSSHL